MLAKLEDKERQEVEAIAREVEDHGKAAVNPHWVRRIDKLSNAGLIARVTAVHRGDRDGDIQPALAAREAAALVVQERLATEAVGANERLTAQLIATRSSSLDRAPGLPGTRSCWAP